MESQIVQWVTLLAWFGISLFCLSLYYDSKGEKKVPRATQAALDDAEKKLAELQRQVTALREQLADALAQLALAGAPSLAVPRASLDPAAPASEAPPLPASEGPRVRVDITRMTFPSERAVLLPTGGPLNELLVVDARDVDEREGTMPVVVLDMRPDVVQVGVPIAPRSHHRVWISRALVIDCPPDPPPPPDDPGGTEGDPRGLPPGDDEEEPVSPTLVSSGAAPSSGSREIPLERAANLSASDVARVDRLAAKLKRSRQAVLEACRDRGLLILERWVEKVKAARRAGEDLKHCGSVACAGSDEGVAGCSCDCAPCARLASLLAAAEREVRGGED
jgi:hypothetical protein